MKSINENDLNLKTTAINSPNSKSCSSTKPIKSIKQNFNQKCTEVVINQSNESTEFEDTQNVRPPDGGFGWVVVFASFMCNVVVDGIIFSFGILLLEISEEFNEKKASTAWIGSLQAGFYLIAGPVVSALANIFGCRKTTIFGSVLASTGFILSFFATNVQTLYVTFGLLGGIGFGFIFLPAIVTVGFYFEKRRAFATGIAVCGSGIGAFVIAPATQVLVELFGWRGCVLILAGVTLNCAVFGSLFRPVEHLRYKSQSQKPLLIRIKEARDALWSESDEEVDEEESPTASQNSAPPPYSEIINMINTTNNNDSDKVPLSSLDYQLRSQPNDKNTFRRRTKSADGSKLCYQTDEMLYSAMSLIVFRKRSSTNASQQMDNKSTKISSKKSVNESNESVEGLSNETVSPSNVCFPSFSEMFDLTLLMSPSFILLSVSGFLCLSGFFIPFMYIADRAKLLGCTPEKSAFLLSVIGITNTIGRVFCGWISDRPQVNALMINNVALTIGGVATILSPILFNSYISLIVYGAIFGFSIACFAALRSVITVELLGLERLTSAFGLLLMFQGIAVTIGSPIAGWFFDITGSYDNSFYLSGSAIALSGIMCFPLSAISKWEKGKPSFGAIN